MGGADQGVDLLAKAAKAHRCTCRARSGREPGAVFFFFSAHPARCGALSLEPGRLGSFETRICFAA